MAGPPKSIQCGICGASFSRKTELLLHVEDHHESRSPDGWNCDDCGWVFDDSLELEHHQIEAGHGGVHRCVNCSAVFPSPKLFDEHKAASAECRAIYEPEDNFNVSCESCKKDFRSEASFNQHLLMCTMPTRAQPLRAPDSSLPPMAGPSSSTRGPRGGRGGRGGRGDRGGRGRGRGGRGDRGGRGGRGRGGRGDQHSTSSPGPSQQPLDQGRAFPPIRRPIIIPPAQRPIIKQLPVPRASGPSRRSPSEKPRDAPNMPLFRPPPGADTRSIVAVASSSSGSEKPPSHKAGEDRFAPRDDDLILWEDIQRRLNPKATTFKPTSQPPVGYPPVGTAPSYPLQLGALGLSPDDEQAMEIADQVAPLLLQCDLSIFNTGYILHDGMAWSRISCDKQEDVVDILNKLCHRPALLRDMDLVPQPVTFKDPSEKLHPAGHYRTSPWENEGALEAIVISCIKIVLEDGFQDVVKVAALDAVTGRVLMNHLVCTDPTVAVKDWHTSLTGLSGFGDIEKARKDGYMVFRGWSAVRSTLQKYMNQETVMIGHNLRSDLDTLRMAHGTGIDVAKLFEDAARDPLSKQQVSLESLSRDLINVRLTNSPTWGRDPLQNVFAIREMVLWVMKNKERLTTIAREKARSYSLIHPLLVERP